MRKFTWSMFSKTLNLKVVNLLAPNHIQKPLLHSSGTLGGNSHQFESKPKMGQLYNSRIWNDLWSFKSFELIFNFKEGHFKSKSNK